MIIKTESKRVGFEKLNPTRNAISKNHLANCEMLLNLLIEAVYQTDQTT
jgi:hypothetical protein